MAKSLDKSDKIDAFLIAESDVLGWLHDWASKFNCRMMRGELAFGFITPHLSWTAKSRIGTPSADLGVQKLQAAAQKENFVSA